MGTEWEPALFLKILNDCRERLQQTLNKFSIFSHACREHSTVVCAPAGSAATPTAKPVAAGTCFVGQLAPPPQFVEPAAAGFERPHSWPAPPQRPLRLRPYRRRRLQPVAAKVEVKNQRNHPPLFLLSLFSSSQKLAYKMAL